MATKQHTTANTVTKHAVRPLMYTMVIVGLFVAWACYIAYRNSIWHDESYSFLMIQASFSKIVYYTSLDVHPPLYYLLLKAWTVVFGQSLLALNAFSISCMVAAVLVVWRLFLPLLGKSIYKYRWLLLIMMFFGPFLVRYGQEMRMYALGALITAVVLWWIRNLLDRPNWQSWWRWALLGVLFAAGFYTHYFLLFNVVTFGLYFLITTIRSKGVSSLWKAWHGWYTTIIAFVVCIAPWLPVAANQFSQVSNGFWIAPLNGSTIFSYPISYVLYWADWELRSWLAILAYLAVAIVAMALYRYWRIPPSNNTFYKISRYWLVVPLLCLIAISLPPLQPAFHTRYLFFWAPVLYGAIGVGLLYGAIRSWVYRVALVLYMVLLIIGNGLLFTAGNVSTFDQKKPFSMNSIVEYIASNTGDNQQVFIISDGLWNFFDLYATAADANLTDNIVVFNKDQYGKYGNSSLVFDRPDLTIHSLNDNRLQNLETVWVVEDVTQKAVSPHIPAHWQLVQTATYGYAQVSQYRITPVTP